MPFRNRNQVYLTSCRKCGGTTSKGFARHNDGQCKQCTLPKCGAEYNHHCLTPAHIGECGTHRPVGSGLRNSESSPKCPDCGGPIAAWKLRKGYHCDSCTRAIEGPAYFSNEISYDGGY